MDSLSKLCDPDFCENDRPRWKWIPLKTSPLKKPICPFLIFHPSHKEKTQKRRKQRRLVFHISKTKEVCKTNTEPPQAIPLILGSVSSPLFVFQRWKSVYIQQVNFSINLLLSLNKSLDSTKLGFAFLLLEGFGIGSCL